MFRLTERIQCHSGYATIGGVAARHGTLRGQSRRSVRQMRLARNVPRCAKDHSEPPFREFGSSDTITQRTGIRTPQTVRHLREHMTNFQKFAESRQRNNFRLGASAGLLLFGLGALIANQMQQRVIMRHEDNLSIAGFVVHRADTPDLQTTLDLLPSHQVLQRVRGETIRYVYADPDVCDCLYVGSQQAYDLYQKQRLARHLADQQRIAARM
jgi:hypothetical protein